MAWITFTEAYELAGITKQTAWNRRRALKERNPTLYNQIVDESGKRTLYHDVKFVEFIKHHTSKVARKNKRKRKKVIPSDKFKSATPLKSETKKKLEEILGPPMAEMDQEERKLYDDLENQQNKVRFEVAVRILHLFKFQTVLSLSDCCKQFGTSRGTFYHWIYSVEQIKQLYYRAKVIRGECERAMYNEDNVMMLNRSARGYNQDLQSTRYKVKKNIDGTVYKVPFEMVESQKHISASPQAAIFWLVNKNPEEFKRNNFQANQAGASGAGYEDPLDKELREMDSEQLHAEYLKVEEQLKQLNG